MGKKIKREIELTGLGITLELGKVNAIHTTGKNFIYIEEMKDGKWRFSFTGIIEDISKLEALTIKRT